MRDTCLSSSWWISIWDSLRTASVQYGQQACLCSSWWKDLGVVCPIWTGKAPVTLREDQDGTHPTALAPAGEIYCSYGQSKSLKRPPDYAHTSRSWFSRGSLSAGCRARRPRMVLRVAAPETQKTIPAHFSL